MNPVLFWVGVLAATLMAMGAIPAVGSLSAIRDDYPLAVGLVRATVIGAVDVYCASMLASWWVYAQDPSLPYNLVPVYVAASSWIVVPAIVALRPA